MYESIFASLFLRAVDFIFFPLFFMFTASFLNERPNLSFFAMYRTLRIIITKSWCFVKHFFAFIQLDGDKDDDGNLYRRQRIYCRSISEFNFLVTAPAGVSGYPEDLK